MEMNRRNFLKSAGITAAAFSIGADSWAESVTKKLQPDILWLISEDTSPDLSCYGTGQVKTPNLDKLAGEGARFTNAFVTAAVCSAARSAFMTGMYQTSIGVHNHRSHRRDNYTLPEPVRVLTEYFRDAGYFTCNSRGLKRDRKGKTDWNFTPAGKGFDGTDWSQRASGQPFFAQVNFSLTHRVFVRDKENPIDPANLELPPYYPDHPITQRDWANYLKSLQVLDSQVGKVLKHLDDEGLADNTIVFYFGDHGRPHVRGKQWLYEGGIHVPLIIRWAGHIKAGKTVNDLVSSIDFAPTCLSFAGIEVPAHMQGQVFLGPDAVRRQYVFAARDRCDGTIDRIRCVRTKRFKYIRNFFPDRPYTQFNGYKKNYYPVLTLMAALHKRGQLTAEQAAFMAPRRPNEEFYDLENDPYELHNLARSHEQQERLKEMREELDRWIKNTGDMGEIPEARDTIASEQARMQKNMKQP